jgi:beta-glucosidase
MERDPRWGRNEEAYGEDPFLAGKLAVNLIKGAQGDDAYWLKVGTTPKHFYANNYEIERNTADSVITDERLKHEYYLRVYEYAFKEGNAVSMMAAYNKMNGIPGMLHPEMNEIVREMWGADAFFVSDGGAFKLVQTEHKAHETYAESAAAAIKAGMDCFLDDPVLVIDAVKEAYERGLLTEKEIDGALRNQLRILFRLGIYGGTEGSPYENITEDKCCSAENAEVVRQASRESVVLLKNDGFLPMNTSVKKIAVVGMLGGENVLDWYSGIPPYQVTPLDGIKKEFPDSDVVYTDACDIASIYNEEAGAWLRADEDGTVHFDGTEATRTTFRVADWGFECFGFMNTKTSKYLTTNYNGELRCDADKFWGWFIRELFLLEEGKLDGGKFKPERPHGVKSEVGAQKKISINIYDKPYSEEGVANLNKVIKDLTVKVLGCGIAEAVEVVKGADATVVVLGNHPMVGARECIDRDTLDLPERWAKLFNSVAEVSKNTVLAMIAGYPFALEKEEATARAVFFTTHGLQEVGTAVAETLSGKNNPAGRLSMTWYFGDTVLPDLNDYDIIANKMTYLYHDKPVLHEFGFGLSYTEFAYADLVLTKTDAGITAEFSVTNIGNADGDEVAQLYFSQKDAAMKRPIKQLAGFERVHVKKGETKQIKIEVPYREFMCFDADKKAFTAVSGEYSIMVGGSSKDIKREGTLCL